MKTMYDKLKSPKRIATAISGSVMIGFGGLAQSSELEIGGNFEFDYVSVKNGSTRSDLTTLEVLFSKEFNAKVSSSLVLAATDGDDLDSTVDDDLEVDSAILTFMPNESGLSLEVGVWASPVGQFNTLSAQDNLAVAQLETLKNRGIVLSYPMGESVSATVFAGTLDNKANADVDGANVTAVFGDATINVGYVSSAATSGVRGTSVAFAYEPGPISFYAETVEIDDTANTKATDYSVSYALSNFEYPVTLGIGQGTLSATGSADTDQTTYTAALALYEGLDLVLDYADLDEPSGKTETTTLKIAYSF